MAEKKKYNFSGLEDTISSPELTSISPEQEEISQLEAGIRGGAQGLTLGTSEDILAGLQAVSDLPQVGFSGLKAAYEKYSAEQGAREKAAQAQHPITYTGAEIGVPLAIPGLGALGAAGKLGKAGGALAKGIQAVNIPGMVVEEVGAGLGALKAIPGLASVAKKAPAITGIAKGATEGAVLGGLYGAGKSEAPLLSERSVEDIKHGAMWGGAIGGAIPTIGVGAKELAIKGATSKGTIGDISRGYLSAIEGKNLADFDKIVNKVYEYGQYTGNKLLIDELSRIKNAFNRLEKSGSKSDISDIFDALKKMREDAKFASDPDAQKIIQGVSDTLENKAFGLEKLIEKQQTKVVQEEIPGQKGVPSSRQQLEEKLPALRIQYESKGFVPEIVEKVDPKTGQAFEQIVLKPLQRTEGGGAVSLKPTFMDDTPENMEKLQALRSRLASEAQEQGFPLELEIIRNPQEGTIGLRKTTIEEPISIADKEFKPIPKTDAIPEIEPRIERRIETEPFFVKERPGKYDEFGRIKEPKLEMGELVELEKLYGQRSASAEGGTPAKEIYKSVDEFLTGKVNELSPEYAQAREQWKQMSRAFEDVGIDPKQAIQMDVGSPQLEQVINKVAPGQMKKINDLIIKEIEGGLEGKAAASELEALFNRLEKGGVVDSQNIRKQLTENIKDYLLSQQMNLGKIAPAVASYNPNVALLGLLKSYGMKGAHQLGRAQVSSTTQKTLGVLPGVVAPQSESPSAELSKKLSYASPEELDQTANMLIQNPSVSHLGKTLQKATLSNNELLKNATILQILQNPEAKKALGVIK